LGFYVERKYATSATVKMLHFVANMFTTLYGLTKRTYKGLLHVADYLAKW
jgi:hypothetical protein